MEDGGRRKAGVSEGVEKYVEEEKQMRKRRQRRGSRNNENEGRGGGGGAAREKKELKGIEWKKGKKSVQEEPKGIKKGNHWLRRWRGRL